MTDSGPEPPLCSEIPLSERLSTRPDKGCELQRPLRLNQSPLRLANLVDIRLCRRGWRRSPGEVAAPYVRRLRSKPRCSSYFNGVLDCADRESIGWNISQRNDAKEAARALEDALRRRFGVLPATDISVVLRTNNALVYASELYRGLAKSHGLNHALALTAAELG